MPGNESSSAQSPKPAWAEKLRSYQWSAAERLASPPDGYRGQILAFAPGYGKTHTALGAFRLRLERDSSTHPCLIVVTTATSRYDWRRIAKQFWPGLSVHLLGDDEPTYQRKDESDEAFALRRDSEWIRLLRGERGPAAIVTSYESLHRITAVMDRFAVLPDMTVLDEAHHVKKMGTARAQNVRPLIARSLVSILSTGTPIHNKPFDLYNLLDLCAFNRWGGLYTWAEKYFMVRVANRGYGRTIDELVNKSRLIEDTKDCMFSVSVAEAFGELPATIRKLVPVKVEGSLRTSPAKLRKQARGNSEGALGLVLRSMVQHKMKTAVQLVTELDEPIVCYTYEREHARQLAQKLNAAGVKTLVAMGEDVAIRRDKTIEAWKNGSATALVCTMDAVRESATLTRASAMLFLDLDWLPGKMLQCEGRIHPSRQPENERRPARYYYLVVQDGPDEVVAEAVVAKVREASGFAGSGEDADKLAATFAPLQKVVDAPSPEALLSAVIARLDAREARLTELGL